MAQRGRKPIDKTIADLDDTLRGEIDEALRSDARESASSVFRRFGLQQRGLKLDTFIKYARKLRQVLWTDEPPLDRTTPSIEEIRDRLLVLMYEQAQAGGIKPYELAAMYRQMQEHDRIELLREANERAQAKFDMEMEKASKALRAAVDGKTTSGEALSREDVYDLIDNVMRGERLMAKSTRVRVRADYLTPYQKAWINDPAPVKLAEKSRQIGWTWAEAFDAVSKRFRKTQPRELNYWYSATDESAGAEFIDYCAWFAQKLFEQTADRYLEQVEAPELRKGFVTAHCIRCPNGARITAMSSNPRRFRGKKGDVRVDECAFHDDAEGMHDAASPATQWGGTYATWSTHNGEGSLFNTFIKTARKIYAGLGIDPNRPVVTPYETLEAKALELGVGPVFSYHRVTILDAIEQGLVEKINEVTGQTLSREKFLQRIKLKVRSIDALNQEYYCIASTDALAWLTYLLIQSCESEFVAPPVMITPGERSIPPMADYTGGPVYVGVDVGRTRDVSFVPIGEEVGDTLWPRQILVMDNIDIPDQVDLIEKALGPVKHKLVRMCVDYTGVGIGVGDGLKKRFGEHRVENIPQNNSTQEIEAIGLLTAMQDKLLRLPANNQKMRDSLHSVRKEFSATGKPRFVAPRTADGHADDFWGFALMVNARSAHPDDVGPFVGQLGPPAVFARGGSIYG